jgi:hypothetical protein
MAVGTAHSQRPLSRLAFAAIAVVTLFAVGGAPAFAQAYKVTLKNGNTFISKYEPEDASYDASRMVIVTDVGNRIALAKDDVENVTVDIENRGFGRVLDTTTIVIGLSANDAPGGEEGEEGDGTVVQVPTPTSYMPTLFSGAVPSPGFPEGGFGFSGGGAEPAEPGANTGGGIPLSFVGSGMAPVVQAFPPN